MSERIYTLEEIEAHNAGHKKNCETLGLTLTFYDAADSFGEPAGSRWFAQVEDERVKQTPGQHPRILYQGPEFCLWAFMGGLQWGTYCYSPPTTTPETTEPCSA